MIACARRATDSCDAEAGPRHLVPVCSLFETGDAEVPVSREKTKNLIEHTCLDDARCCQSEDSGMLVVRENLKREHAFLL